MWLFFLSTLPILILIVLIIGFHISMNRAGALAAAAAILLSLFVFGSNVGLLGTALEKGLNMAIYVLLIVWTSLFLYNAMQTCGLMNAIAATLSNIKINRLGLALIIGWSFAGFIEGATGFGVPVAILAPLLIALGFKPLTSLIMVLVGHSWAVTFGGMSTAYFTIQLSTGLQDQQIGTIMAVLFSVPIILTGLMVAHIEGGWSSVKKAAPSIVIAGIIMDGCLWGAIHLNVPQIAGMIAGLGGAITIWILSYTPVWIKSSSEPIKCGIRSSINFHLAFLPYYSIVVLGLLLQLPFIKDATANIALAFDYPGGMTSSGYIVEPALSYAKIKLFGHPAPIIIVSTLITLALFLPGSRQSILSLSSILMSTLKQAWRPTLGIILIVSMSLVMNDSGMSTIIAKGIAKGTGIMYPVVSPFLGVLGSFMTGSNANSNIMFGALQVSAAAVLEINPAIIASAQTIGGSLGAAIAPAKILLGSSATGMHGLESELLRKTLVYCVSGVIVVGLVCMLLVQVGI